MRKGNNILLKIISLCVAFAFTHQQIVWAAGEMVLPASEQPVHRYEALFDNAAPGQRPRGLGIVEDVHTQGDTSVISIQDCHSSLSAQYSIVDILSRLVSQYDLDLVAIEGGTGYIDTAALKSLPDETMKKRTADFLMRNGRISAGEFFAATSNKNIALYGVEDNELYRKNLESFRSIHEVNGENLDLIREIFDALREKEKDVYNPELYKTVFRTRLHREGRIGLDVYLEHLLENADKKSINTVALSEIRRFKKSVQLEKDLDFEEATGQRNELVKLLTGLMDSSGLKEMIRTSMRFRNGKLEQAEYHLWLEEKARENEIGLQAYPELQRFIRYAKSYSCINILQLQHEVRTLRDKVIEERITSGEEERLYRTVRTVELLEGLFSVRLSRTEAERMKALLAELSAGQLVTAVEGRTEVEAGELRRMLRMAHQALRFYELTRKRDAAMLSNTIRAMQREKTRVAALISGGHHSGGLTELMKEQGLSYLVFMPEYRSGEERPYVAVLTRKTDAYKRTFPGSGYDLAIEAYFDTGDIDRLEEMFAYALGNLVRQGEDPARMAELWARRYESFFDTLSDERVSAMNEKPIAPSDFRKKLCGARVIRNGKGDYVVAFRNNAFYIGSDGVEPVGADKLTHYSSSLPRSKVITFLTVAVTGVFSFLGPMRHEIRTFLERCLKRRNRRPSDDFSAPLKEKGSGDYLSRESILYSLAGFSSTDPIGIREHILETEDAFYPYFGPEGYRDEIEAFFVDNRITEMLELYDIDADELFHVELSETMSMRGADLMWDPESDEIFMVLLKRSPAPFADNAGNGLVGINRGVFEVLGGKYGKNLLKVVLLVGITHELRHECGQTDEEALIEEDVRVATELAGRYGVNRRQIVTALRDLTDEGGFLKEMERAIIEDPTLEEKKYQERLQRQKTRLLTAIVNVNEHLKENWITSDHAAELRQLAEKVAAEPVVEFFEQEDLDVPFRIKPGTENDPVFQVMLKEISAISNEDMERTLIKSLTYAMPSVLRIKQRAEALQQHLVRIAREWETLIESSTEEGNDVRRIFKSVIASAIHIHYLSYSHLLEYAARQALAGNQGFPAESIDPSLVSLFRRYADRRGQLNENVKSKLVFSVILPENRKQLVKATRKTETSGKGDLEKQRWLLQWLKDPEYFRAKVEPAGSDKPGRAKPKEKTYPTGPGGLSALFLGILTSLSLGLTDIKAEENSETAGSTEESPAYPTGPPANVDTSLDYEDRMKQAQSVAGYAVGKIYSERDVRTRRNAFILLMATARHESDGFKFRKGRANGHDRGLVHVNRDTAYNIIRYAVDKRSRNKGPELARALTDVFNRVFDRQIDPDQLKHISRRQWGAYLVWSDVMAFSMACARLRWDRRVLPDGAEYADIDTYARAIADYWVDVYNRTTGYAKKNRFRKRMFLSTRTLLVELRRNGYEPVGPGRDWDIPAGQSANGIEVSTGATRSEQDVPRSRSETEAVKQTGVRGQRDKEKPDKEKPVQRGKEPDLRALLIIGSSTVLAGLIYWLVLVNRNIRRRVVRRGGKGPVYRAALRSELKRFMRNARPGDVYTLPLTREILRYPDIRKILSSSENALNIGVLPRTLYTHRKYYAIMMGKGHSILRGFGRKLSDYRVVGHMHPVEAGEQTDIFPGARDIWDALKTARETGLEKHFILHKEGVTYYRVKPGRTRAPTPEEDVMFFSDMDDMSISGIKELLMNRFGVHIRVTGRHHEETITTRIIEHPFTAAAVYRAGRISLFAGLLMAISAAVTSYLAPEGKLLLLFCGSALYAFLSATSYYFLGKSVLNAYREIGVSRSEAMLSHMAERRRDGSVRTGRPFEVLEQRNRYAAGLVLRHERFKGHFEGELLGILSSLPLGVGHLLALVAGSTARRRKDIRNIVLRQEGFDNLKTFIGSLERDQMETAQPSARTFRSSSKVLDAEGLRDLSGALKVWVYGEPMYYEAERVKSSGSVSERGRAVKGIRINGWSFTLDTQGFIPGQVQALAPGEVDLDIFNKIYYWAALDMLNNVPGGKIVWNNHISTHRGGKLHFHLFDSARLYGTGGIREICGDSLPIEKAGRKEICSGADAEGGIYRLEDYPSPDHAITVFMVEGGMEDQELMSARCYDVEKMIRAEKKAADKIFIRDGSTVRVYFILRKAGFAKIRDKGDKDKRLISPLEMAGIWPMYSQQEYEGFDRERRDRINSRVAILDSNPVGERIEKEIHRNFRETEGSGILPPMVYFLLRDLSADQDEEQELLSERSGQAMRTVDEMHGKGVQRINMVIETEDAAIQNMAEWQLVGEVLERALEKDMTTALYLKGLAGNSEALRQHILFNVLTVLPRVDKLIIDAAEHSEELETVMDILKRFCGKKSVELFSQVDNDNKFLLYRLAEYIESVHTSFPSFEWQISTSLTPEDATEITAEDYRNMLSTLSKAYPRLPMDVALFPREDTTFYVREDGEMYVEGGIPAAGKDLISMGNIHTPGFMDRRAFHERTAYIRKAIKRQTTYIPLADDIKRNSPDLQRIRQVIDHIPLQLRRRAGFLFCDELVRAYSASRDSLRVSYEELIRSVEEICPTRIKEHLLREKRMAILLLEILGGAETEINVLRLAVWIHHLGKAPRWQYPDRFKRIYAHIKYLDGLIAKDRTADQQGSGHITSTAERVLKARNGTPLIGDDLKEAMKDLIRERFPEEYDPAWADPLARSIVDPEGYARELLDRHGVRVPRDALLLFYHYGEPGKLSEILEQQREPANITALDARTLTTIAAVIRIASILNNRMDSSLQEEIRGGRANSLAEAIIFTVRDLHGDDTRTDEVDPALEALLVAVREREKAIMDAAYRGHDRRDIYGENEDHSFIRFLAAEMEDHSGPDVLDLVDRYMVQEKGITGSLYRTWGRGLRRIFFTAALLSMGTSLLLMITVSPYFLLLAASVYPLLWYGKRAADRYAYIGGRISEAVSGNLLRERKGSETDPETTAIARKLPDGRLEYLDGFGALRSSGDSLFFGVDEKVVIRLHQPVKSTFWAMALALPGVLYLANKIYDETKHLNLWFGRHKRDALKLATYDMYKKNARKLRGRMDEMEFDETAGRWIWKRGNGVGLIAMIRDKDLRKRAAEIQGRLKELLPDNRMIQFTDLDRLHVTVIRQVEPNTSGFSRDQQPRSREARNRLVQALRGQRFDDLALRFSAGDIALNPDGSIFLVGMLDSEQFQKLRDVLEDRFDLTDDQRKNIFHITIARVFAPDIREDLFEDIRDSVMSLRKQAEMTYRVNPELYVWDQSGPTPEEKFLPLSTEISGQPEKERAPPVSPERDMKGRNAGRTDPIIRHHIKSGNMIELFERNGCIVAYRLRWVNDHEPGLTYDEVLFADEVDVNSLLSSEEQTNLKDWLYKHPLPDGRGYVHFRVVQDAVALNWTDDTETVNISHAGYRDGCIYMGGRLLSSLFKESEDSVRTELLDRDEYQHLIDETYDSREDMFEHQRRLNLVAPRIISILSDLPEEYGIEKIDSHEKALERYPYEDIRDPRIIRWGWFSPFKKTHRVTGMRPLQILSGIYVMRPMEPAPEKVMMKLWMRSADSSDKWREQRMVLLHVNDTGGGNEYIFKGRIPAYFEGEYTIMFSVDGGRHWSWTNKGPGDNRLLTREIRQRRTEPRGYRRASGADTPHYEKYRIIRLYDGQLDMSARIASARKVPQHFRGGGVKHKKSAKILERTGYGFIETTSPENIYVLFADMIRSPSGEEIGRMIVYYDAVSREVVVDLGDARSQEKIPHEDSTRGEKLWGRARIRMPLDANGNISGLIHEKQLMGLSRAEISILLHYSGLEQNMPELLEFIEREMVLYHVDEQLIRRESAGKRMLPSGAVKKALGGSSDSITGSDIKQLESIITDSKSNTLGAIALMCLRKLTQSRLYSREKYLEYAYELTEKRVLEGMATLERTIRQDTAFLGRLGLRRQDIESVFLYWFISYRNKVIFRVTFRMKNGERRVMALEVRSPLGLSNEMDMAKVERTVKLWQSLSEKGVDTLPEVYAVQKIEDYQPKFLDTPLPGIIVAREGDFEVEAGTTRNARVLHEDMLVVAREFIEGYHLTDYSANASSSKEEEGRVTVAGIKAYLRMWRQGLDPDTEMGPGLVDPDPRYVVVTRSIPPGYPLNDRYSGYVCELDRLEKGFTLSEIIAALNSSGYRKQDILQAAREVLDPAKSDFIERNYASITSSSALRRVPVNSITTDNISEQDMKEILPRIIRGNETAHPEDQSLFDVKVETALQIIRRAASRSERVPEELLGKLRSRAEAIRRGDEKGCIRSFPAYRGLDNGLGAVQAVSYRDDIYLSDSIVSDPELGLSENITYMLMLLLLSRIKMEETNDLDIARERIEKYWSGLGGPGGIADLLMESAFDPGSCKRREGFAERSAVRAHIRAVMERKVLKRDLVDFQRLPDRERARKNAVDFINALYLLVRDRPDIKSGHALEEFLSAEAGVRKFIIGGGKGTRFSPGGYMVKQLFKPDNYNTNIKMARLSASFGSLEDVAVVDGITVFKILKDNTEVGAGLKKAIRTNIRNRAGILMASGSISSEEATKLVREMGRIIERDLIYTVKEDGIKDLGFVIRQADKTIRNMLSADDTRVQFLVDKMSYAIFKVLLSDRNLIDSGKKNRLLGENCIVVLDSGDGHGSAYFEAISDLDRIGRIGEARYSVIIHGDSPGWGLDDYPNYIFITYLKMIAGFDPATPEIPKVAIAVKNPDDGRARGRARVFLRHDERCGMVPHAVKEWNDLTPQEKAEASAMAENRDRNYWTNGNILICDTPWASDKGDMFKRAFKHSLGETGRMKRRMFEYWVSDLLNLAVGQHLRRSEEPGEGLPWAMAVMIEGEAPNANKTLNRALDYSARMRNNLVDKVRSLGVEVDEDVNLSISPGTVDASYDIDKVLMDIFGDNLREPEKRAGAVLSAGAGTPGTDLQENEAVSTRLRGTIHLGSYVRIGRGSVLDGREKDVSLTGRSIVDRGVHVKGITARDAHLTEDSSALDTRMLVNGPVPGRKEALEATHLEDVPFADLGIIADKGTDIWLIRNDVSEDNIDALKRIFGGVSGDGTWIRDQIFLSGQIVLEDTVRVENGTSLDGRGRNIVLTGESIIGSGVRLRGVRASDTVFHGPPVMDAYTYRQPSRETPPPIENCVFTESVVEYGARAKEAFVRRSYLSEGSETHGSDLEAWFLGYDETAGNLRYRTYRDKIMTLVKGEEAEYVPGMYRMREVPEEDAREIKAHQLRQAGRNYARFIKDETLLKRLEEETRSFLNSRVSDHMTTQQIRRFVISKIRCAIDRYDLESRHKLRDPLRGFYPLSSAVRDVAAELMDDMRAIDPGATEKNREFFRRLCVLSARYNLIDFSIDPAVFNTGGETRGVRGDKKVISDIVERNTAPVPAIDGIEAFGDLVFREDKGFFVFLPDNIGETEIDAVMWAFLLRMGHKVVVAPKDGFSYGDIQQAEVEAISRSYPELKKALRNGRLRIVPSGSSGEGTFLDLASDELTEILADSALTAIIGKGQANLFTLPARNALRVPYVCLCLSKSRTSTRITGVPVGRRDDGSRFFRPVIAVVPEGQRITTPDGEKGFKGVISRFEPNRIVGEDEKDDGHPLTIQRIRRFRRAMLSLALALTLGTFGIYLSGSMSGIYVTPALAVPVLICLGLIRYYSLERGIQQAFMKYIFLDKALTGVLEEDEQTLARLNSEHIAERQSTGIVVFHEAFNFLSGKHQELVRAHEACRNCFFGMLVLWPFYGGTLLKMAADHMSGVWYGRATDGELKVKNDYSDLEQALEKQLRNNIETEFLQEEYAGGAENVPGPEGSDRTASLKEGHPFVKILDLSGRRDVRSKARMLQFERSHGRCTFCERAAHSEEAERAEAGWWSFSPDPNPVFRSQIVGINMKHVDQSVTGPEYFYDIFNMLKNLKGWKVAWPSRMGTGIPEHMHIHLFNRPAPLPVQSPVFESERSIFTDRTGEGVISLLRGYPDPDNEAAVFTVEGRAARINKLTKRCGDVETIIRKAGLESDKIIVTEEDGRRIKVFFFPRTKRVNVKDVRGEGITVGPIDLAGTWRTRSEKNYAELLLRDVVAGIGEAVVSLETRQGSELIEDIRQHFEESEGSGIFPPSMDLMVTYDCNLNCPVCWGSYMPKHHIFWPGGDIESINYREGKKHHRDGRETDLGKEERTIKSKLENCFPEEKGFEDIAAIVYKTASPVAAGKEEESRTAGKGKDIRRLEEIQVYFEGGRMESLLPGSDKYQNMVLSVQKKMIDIMYENGMRRMVFTGGEPLMNSNLPALLKYARSKGVTTWLFTNALLLTRDMAEIIMPNVDMVSFSLDGPDETSNTKNRRKGHFTAVMRVLDLMKDYPDTQVQILTVVTARNRERIRDIGALLRKKAKALKGFQWKLNHYKRIGRSQKEHDIRADKFLLDYGEFKDLARSVQRQFSDMRVRYSPLDHDRAYLFVFPDGTLATTVGARYEELGNILDPGVMEEEQNITVFREITDKIQERAIYIPTKEKAGTPEFKRRNLMGEEGPKIISELHSGLKDKLDEHMERVSRIAVRIARRLRQKGEDITEHDIHVLRMAGLVHDIGAREKYEKDLEEARNRINAGISRDKVEPTRRALVRWANEKAPLIRVLDKSELEGTLAGAYRTGDFYPLYRMYIKYSALEMDPLDDLTPKEERVARNIFSHGGVSIEELRDKGIGFPDMLGLIVRYHHDYNSLHDKLSSMILDGRMSPEKADKTSLLATVLILSDVLEQGNNYHRNTVLRGRQTETFDLTFDEFNGFIWKRFKQMEMISDTRALEALKDLFAVEEERSLDADLSGIIRESRGAADGGAQWLRDGDRRFMDELREDRTTRLYFKQDTDIVIGIEAGLLEKLGPDAVSDIKKIPFVSAVMGLKKRTKQERLKELSDRTWGTRAIAALIDEDVFQAYVTNEELESEIKNTVKDFVDRARKDIAGIMDPDKGQLTPESIDRMRDINGLREIMAVLMRAMPESRSYGLNELSLRQMRIESSFYALKNSAAGVRLTDRVLDASGQHHLVHYADGDRIMEEKEEDGRAIMLPGLEILRRRERQQVSRRLDRFHDRFYITAPSGISTEAGKKEFRRNVMDLWMLNGVVPAEDIVVLDRTEKVYSASDIFSEIKDRVPGITPANAGIRVIAGDLKYDKRAAEQGVLQVQLEEGASSSIDQYSVFVNLLVAGAKRWAYTVPGLEEVRGRLYIYIPQAHCVELEKEIRSYHELYVKSVLVDA